MIDPPEATVGGTGDRDRHSREDDQDDRWGAIDLLLHGEATRTERPAGSTRPGRPAPDRRSSAEGGRWSTADDAPGPSPAGPALLRDPRGWSLVLEAETARWLRYGRPCLVLQVEVGGIAAIADRFGESSAERLVAILVDQLVRTRRTDLYARTDRWRFQGLLTETTPTGIDAYAGRLRQGYLAATGPVLPLGLNVGIAAPEPGERLVAALRRAEQAMYHEAHRGAGDQGQSATRVDRRDVRDSLRELERLRLEALVTAEEHRVKRAEILARL